MKNIDFTLKLLLKSLVLLFVFIFQSYRSKAQVSVTFYYDSVVQNYTVPVGVTSMTVTAVGGMGGGSGNDTYAAGYGASITGKCTVTPGHNISIVVAHEGYTSDQFNTGGGGGASFVFDSNNGTVLIIGAGGGGEGFSFTAGGANGGNGGIIYTSPYTPTNSPQGSGAIVSGGHGGKRGSYIYSNGPGAGGGGWLFNGDSVGGGSAADIGGGPFGCTGGKDRTNHFIGGNGLVLYSGDVNYGGFGGGAGGGYNGGGGGGGYNGGGGGNTLAGNEGGGGGGGGSYLSGTIVGTPTATNDSNGYVVITYNLPPLSVTAVATTQVSCRTGNNGKATATASFGTSPYTYSWSNGQTNAIATGLTAGSYTITVTDNVAATATASVTITQPATIVGITIASHINVNCRGNSTGSVTANTATGGNSPYTYAWSPSGGTALTASNLSSNTYTITVTDSHGCTATASVNITQPAAAMGISIASKTDITCNGFNNGSITANSATGGTSPYTYAWTPSGGTGLIASSLAPNTYTIAVTDNHGCTATASDAVSQPTPVSVTISSETDALCNGNTGTALAGANGGTGVFTYLWNDANTTTGASLSAIAGTYTVTAIDANGCAGTTSITIGQPTAVNVIISSSSNVLCYGNNGGATASANGGTGTITYSWNDANSTAGATLSAVAGTYTVTAKDANGCTATTSVTITQPSTAISVTISSETDALCFGNNGSATAGAGGGTGTITYKWNDANSSGGATLTTIAGTYTVTARDANGCTATTSVTINQPLTAVSVIISSETNATCHGTLGSATASASGGTGTITYKWNDAGSTANATLSALAGTYTVTAKDANGCTATASVTISQPGAFTATVTVLANIVCNGNATANASANPTGGVSPYTYKWSNGTTTTVSTSNPTGAILPAHAYTITITDNHGCTATSAVTITQPQAIRDSITNVTNANCTNNGVATLGVKYGTLPYTYTWTPGGMTTATVTGLAAQTYTATVTDVHGCVGTAKKAVITNIGSTLRDSISLVANIGCYGGNGGQLSVGTRGGVLPYTYLWSNGGTAYTISNLTAGSYTITVTDNIGCNNAITATLTQPPTVLAAIQASITYPQCSGGKGTASVNVTGGTPIYKYAWAPVACTVASCTSLTAGTYTVTTSDAHGCKSLVYITMTQPVAIRDTNVVALKVNVSCNGQSNGSATMGIKYGTTPYTYHWSNGQTNVTATGLSAGVYSLTVTDVHGCTGTTATVTITQPAAALSETIGSITCTNSLVKATSTAAGGTSPYTYSWSPGGGTKATMSNLTPGSYTITVTDHHGCSTSVVQNLACPPARLDEINKDASTECCGGLDNISLYPNPNTGRFTLTGLEQGMIVEIYDYTGRKVNSQFTIDNSQLIINITDQPNGIYLIRILDSSGNLVSRKKVVKTN